MSVWCQFCDKEMMFEKQATIVSGFITCGSHQCQSRANGRVEEFAREALAKEEHQSRMCMFSTKTPEDDSTWRLVAQKDHPEAVKNVDVMGHLRLGHMLFDEEEKVYYCAKTSLEVINQAKESLTEGPAE
tara:strand:+ start:31075 stop:31464 length:390 start_codon:yes stop_codon:yes gene_type:complete